jgi:hypothetical protein
MTVTTQAFTKEIWDFLCDLTNVERPTQDVLLEALAVAAGRCVVCSVAAPDRRGVTRDLCATIERYVSVVSVHTANIEATGQPKFNSASSSSTTTPIPAIAAAWADDLQQAI